MRECEPMDEQIGCHLSPFPDSASLISPNKGAATVAAEAVPAEL